VGGYRGDQAAIDRKCSASLSRSLKRTRKTSWVLKPFIRSRRVLKTERAPNGERGQEAHRSEPASAGSPLKAARFSFSASLLPRRPFRTCENEERVRRKESKNLPLINFPLSCLRTRFPSRIRALSISAVPRCKASQFRL
jgi:hypothetical protein